MSDTPQIAPTTFADRVERSLREAVDEGVLWNTADPVVYAGRYLEMNGERLLNFGGCSYMGLEQRSELRNAAIEAIQTYGTQFSYSRAYLQCPLYQTLESHLEKITGGFPLVTPSTSLGHIATLPVLVQPDDGVIIDIAAHASVHTAAALVRCAELVKVRHNDVEELSSQIARLTRCGKRVWYLLDGLYSMLGDFAPFSELEQLLVRFPTLHLYVDDAHSTSWSGEHGRGQALSRLHDKSRVVVALSLNKAFAAAGGAIVFPTPEARARVRLCGGPMVFSGPVQPPMLGAAVASAELHLSSSFEIAQRQLMQRIDLTTSLARAAGLTLASYDRSPIFFVQCGTREKTFAVAHRLRSFGIYACISVFPAVADHDAGIRFTISLHNNDDDIGALVKALAAEVRIAA